MGPMGKRMPKEPRWFLRMRPAYRRLDVARLLGQKFRDP